MNGKHHGQALHSVMMRDHNLSLYGEIPYLFGCKTGFLCVQQYPKYVNQSCNFHISLSLVIRQSVFHPKWSQKSRSVLKDGSRYLGLFRKGWGKTFIIAKLHRTDLVICNHFREGNLSYSRINM